MFNKLIPIALLACAPAYTYAEQLIDKDVKTPDIRVGSINIMASRMGSTDNLVMAIKGMNADIIALQEVDKLTNRSSVNFSAVGSKPIDQAKYIADKLGMQSYFCGAIEHDGGEYGSAVISKYPIKLVKKSDLPNAEGGEQRTACAVEIEVPDYPAPLMIVATHLDHSSPELRLKQVDYLQTQFSSWQFAHALPIIIGDLNFAPTSEEYKNMTAWFNDTDVDLQLTAPSWNPDRKIDYILTSNAQEWDVKSVDIPKPMDKVGEKTYAEVTDHLPMIVEMNLINQ